MNTTKSIVKTTKRPRLDFEPWAYIRSASNDERKLIIWALAKDKLLEAHKFQVEQPELGYVGSHGRDHYFQVWGDPTPIIVTY